MAALDEAYNNRDFIEGADAFPPRWQARAKAFRQKLGARAILGQSYGDSPRQTYDLFMPEQSALGLMVFVHGGYWRMFDHSIWSYLATGALQHRWAVAMPSYDLCPQVRIPYITRQLAQFLSVISARVAGPITLTGHSAGGHLVSRMLAPDMLAAPLSARIKGVVPISPVADLRPLLQTSMNDDFCLDLAAAEAESPVLQPASHVPVRIWVGGAERPAFLDQARWLADAWGCEMTIAPHKHHFDVIDALEDPQSDLIRTLTLG